MAHDTQALLARAVQQVRRAWVCGRRHTQPSAHLGRRTTDCRLRRHAAHQVQGVRDDVAAAVVPAGAGHQVECVARLKAAQQRIDELSRLAGRITAAAAEAAAQQGAAANAEQQGSQQQQHWHATQQQARAAQQSLHAAVLSALAQPQPQLTLGPAADACGVAAPGAATAPPLVCMRAAAARASYLSLHACTPSMHAHPSTHPPARPRAHSQAQMASPPGSCCCSACRLRRRTCSCTSSATAASTCARVWAPALCATCTTASTQTRCVGRHAAAACCRRMLAHPAAAARGCFTPTVRARVCVCVVTSRCRPRTC
jgi:hypothetical protein